MLYRPEEGAMWDPMYLVKDGKFYMMCMHRPAPDYPDSQMWLAESADGVHWHGIGSVIENKNGVFKMFGCVTPDGRIAINFGSSPNEERRVNNTLRYYVSDDLMNWEYAGENSPDSRWYNEGGRWDHMYIYKEKDKDGSDVYYGYPVATPKPELKSCFGLMKSCDGLHWEQLPPPVIQWGEYPPINCLEGGGMEKIGDRYYYIGGFIGYAGSYGYNCYVMTADRPEGPFRPDRGAYRLCGNDRIADKVFIQTLPSFFRNGEEVMISGGVMAGGIDDVWLLPAYRTVIDSEGHLHLGWWEKNTALRGKKIEVNTGSFSLVSSGGLSGIPSREGVDPVIFETGENSLHLCSEAAKGPTVSDATALVMLTHKMDFNEGLIFEGKMVCSSAPKYNETEHCTNCWRPARIGFLAGEGETQGTAVTLDIGHPYKRCSYVMETVWDEKRLKLTIIDENGEDCAMLRGIDAGTEHTFRYLYRRNVFMLYVDDLLVQVFVNMAPGDGRVGIFVQNAECKITDITMYTMSICENR